MCDTSLSVSDACPCPIHVQDGYGGSGEVSVLPRLAVLDLLILKLATNISRCAREGQTSSTHGSPDLTIKQFGLRQDLICPLTIQ